MFRFATGGSALLSGLITFKGLRISITFITAKNFFFLKLVMTATS